MAWSPPSGWTLVRRMDQTAGSSNSLAVYTKVAGASEPSSFTWTFSTSSGSAGGIQAFSGVATTSFVDAEAGRVTPISLTHAAGAVITSSSYVWDVASSPPVVLWDGTRFNVYGIGLIGWKGNGSNLNYGLHDGLGSTTEVIDASGNVVESMTYDAFGAVRGQTGTDGNDFKFAGEQQDDASGYHYLRARYYDDASGRFLGKDLSGGGYSYALNNPATWTDPLGLYPICGVAPPEGVSYVADDGGCIDSTYYGLPADYPVTCTSERLCIYPDGSIYSELEYWKGMLGKLIGCNGLKCDMAIFCTDTPTRMGDECGHWKACLFDLICTVKELDKLGFPVSSPSLKHQLYCMGSLTVAAVAIFFPPDYLLVAIGNAFLTGVLTADTCGIDFRGAW